MSRKIFIRLIGILAFVLFQSIIIYPAGAGPTITLVKTLDYPVSGASTLPFGINNSNMVVGLVTFPNGPMAGFRIDANSNPPVVTELQNPAGDGTDTQALGINDTGIIAGIYQNAATQTLRGYQLKNDIYSDYNGAPLCTNGLPCPSYLFGINNFNRLVGEWFPSPSSPLQAFATINGKFTSLTVPLSNAGSVAYGLSNNNSYITGYSIDSTLHVHGFLWVNSVQAAQTRDAPGYAATFLYGVNNQQVMTGHVVDGAGVVHGIASISNTWVTYDFPGAANFTSLYGINDQGIATGFYFDGAGIAHGLLLKVALH